MKIYDPDVSYFDPPDESPDEEELEARRLARDEYEIEQFLSESSNYFGVL